MPLQPLFSFVGILHRARSELHAAFEPQPKSLNLKLNRQRLCNNPKQVLGPFGARNHNEVPEESLNHWMDRSRRIPFFSGLFPSYLARTIPFFTGPEVWDEILHPDFSRLRLCEALGFITL